MTSPADMNDDVGRLVRLAGAKDAIDAGRAARVRGAVHDAWRDECFATQTKTRRTWRLIAVPATAAAAIVAAYAVWRLVPTPAPAPVIVARIDRMAEPATGSSAPYAAGSPMMSGSTLTTSAGTLAMTLTNGVQLRLDAASSARVNSASDVTLERGALYVDSGRSHLAQPGASPISIHTPEGLVRDLGTRFEVRLTGDGTRIRVRDGQVSLTLPSGADARAGSGEELFAKAGGSDRSIIRRPVPVTGSEWAWAERAAPPFSMEGKTLGALLDWVSREGAWTLTFADSRLEAGARATVIHGRPDLLKGLTAAEVLQVVLPTCGLRHHMATNINGGRQVVIEVETGK